MGAYLVLSLTPGHLSSFTYSIHDCTNYVKCFFFTIIIFHKFHKTQPSYLFTQYNTFLMIDTDGGTRISAESAGSTAASDTPAKITFYQHLLKLMLINSKKRRKMLAYMAVFVVFQLLSAFT